MIHRRILHRRLPRPHAYELYDAAWGPGPPVTFGPCPRDEWDDPTWLAVQPDDDYIAAQQERAYRYTDSANTKAVMMMFRRLPSSRRVYRVTNRDSHWWAGADRQWQPDRDDALVLVDYAVAYLITGIAGGIAGGAGATIVGESLRS